MRPSLYRLTKNHSQYFKNDLPVSMPYMMRVLFDYWHIPNVPREILLKETCMDNASIFSNNIREFYKENGGLFLCLFFENNLIFEEKKKEFFDNHVVYRDYKFLFGNEADNCPDKTIENAKDSLKSDHHQRLMRSVEEKGIMHPITIMNNLSEEGRPKIVLEGKHRALISLLFKLEKVPCFLVDRVYVNHDISGWWVTFREFIKISNKNFERYGEEFSWKE